MMAGFGRFDTAFHAAPTHDSGIGSQSAFDNFIPADQLFPFLFQQVFHAVDKIALQFVFVFQVLRFHAGLAARTFVPETFETFIPADMDIFVREKGGDFRQYLVHKLEGGFFADAKRVLVFSVEFISYADSLRRFHTGQFGIGDKSCEAMARNIYFRNDAHIPFCRVGQHLFHVVLRVEASVSRLFAGQLLLALPPLSYTGCTPSADLRQTGQ